jgi:hypothetical protein
MQNYEQGCSCYNQDRYEQKCDKRRSPIPVAQGRLRDAEEVDESRR